jgi:hypothetical protein
MAPRAHLVCGERHGGEHDQPEGEDPNAESNEPARRGRWLAGASTPREFGLDLRDALVARAQLIAIVAHSCSISF